METHKFEQIPPIGHLGSDRRDFYGAGQCVTDERRLPEEEMFGRSEAPQKNAKPGGKRNHQNGGGLFSAQTLINQPDGDQQREKDQSARVHGEAVSERWEAEQRVERQCERRRENQRYDAWAHAGEKRVHAGIQIGRASCRERV